ncbi:uncharacterized protein LY89DRAFT_734432 [Mollisia scopiformis]|uniref:Uncharacterized protein n=1 Tax=Mollisia scopiformis TaxID=149040 RepID=A0A194X883_MOLSC|nr:uncharacterized protein LY89DRAFT_734432 [Mollisia scopiformis]KUJ16324.1 hypothetical protein LY89DRAFT_734432 [Mollisia scopiformis]
MSSSYNDSFRKFCTSYSYSFVFDQKLDNQNAFWEFCFDLLKEFPDDIFTDAGEEEEEVVPQWLLDIRSQWSNKVEKKMACPAKCTLCSWASVHTVEEALAYEKDLELFREEQFYESVLISERLAMILLHDRTADRLATMDPADLAEYRRYEWTLSIEARDTKDRIQDFNDRILELKSKIKPITNASDPTYYCLRRELMLNIHFRAELEYKTRSWLRRAGGPGLVLISPAGQALLDDIHELLRPIKDSLDTLDSCIRAAFHENQDPDDWRPNTRAKFFLGGHSRWSCRGEERGTCRIMELLQQEFDEQDRWDMDYP